ncbi:RHS repeat-associated core domain-containing protein [uncultured Capnocytophaga sp.]|uniref:RHS repeat domain-containing protein n=3 Tax=Capnocytophaga TaxID=1016 RepID=UPI00259683AF|nr:RHS repeat-associated core domain-containing protein [uncultured Capnocytophaga sp.]
MLKHYSHDGSTEIVCNKTDNSTKFILYLGGDAYSAPAILISNGEASKLYYLHRDYLGSIVMLTDEDGNIAERRHFDPWGQPIKVEDSAGNTLDKLTLLDRGFTGHEHLQTVGLIHMNGRLYDPALHRFLQPDNFVQDPFYTQNFNRYGYCLNNPLLYTDPTGEWFVIDDAIAMLVGGVVNLTINAIQGNVTSFWSGLGYFAVGVGAGAASLYGGPLAAGAVLGLGNNITSQVSQNGWSNISLTSAIIDTGIGMGSAYLGGQISSKFSGVFSKVFNSISSPILKNVLINSTSNAASGFLLSAGISFAYTKDFDQALKDGVKGAGYGLALGSALGVVQGFQYARGYDVNPWTGKRNDFFKGTWYSDRVLGNMFNTSDAFHSFPENVKAFQMDGVVTPLKGKDGVIVPILKIPGSYRGKEGYFEFIKERDGMINHRFFRPNSK